LAELRLDDPVLLRRHRIAVTYFVLFPVPHHLPPDSPVCWFLMQAGNRWVRHRMPVNA
jgi:hypothetical protein